MKLGELHPALFVERLNRFVCTVELGGRRLKVLLRNTGRLRELLVPGRKVFVRKKSTGKYSYELILVEFEGRLVCVDSHLPPKLLIEYLLKESYPWYVDTYRTEFKLNSSRFDLLLNDRVLIETKSVNLVLNSTALFPDAPTPRGRKHIEELMNSADLYEPAVVFVIQREDAQSFSPNRDTDPEFSELLGKFYRKGFTVKAFTCRVNVGEISIKDEVPVIF
jgi:sugar fermentation stimulation protein A